MKKSPESSQSAADEPERTKPGLKRLFGAFAALTDGIDLPDLRKWLTVSLLIGLASGLAAIAFYSALEWAGKLFLGTLAGYAPPLAGGEGAPTVTTALRPFLIPVVTTLGGLLAGLLVFKLAPEAEGHGTDAAINSFHNKNGFIRRRVPLVKLLASAVTIGSGGSAGREGPIALVAAGVGSMVADILKLNSRERRIALAIGIGAGVGAIFKAPLGGAILSSEIMYKRDFESEALLPSFVASIVGYSIFGSWHGWQPIFGLGADFAFTRPLELVGYAILGVACGLGGIFFGRSFYFMRDFFRKLRIPAYLKPAIGGLLIGLIALWMPQVLGAGYGWIQLAIDGNYTLLPVGMMLGLIFAKMLATGFTVGSGGSGGVFAPGLMIGAMTGGTLWSWLSRIGQIVPATPAPFVIIGMMTLFGGIAKAPLAIMIMVSEMTGGYHLLIPCMLSVVIAYFLTGRNYIYENQVSTRADSPAHSAEYSFPLLKKVKVRSAMTARPVTADRNMSLDAVSELMLASKLDGLPVVDEGRLTGIIARLDLARVPEQEWPSRYVGDKMTTALVTGYADETVYQALRRMNSHNISHLPIVDREDEGKLVGMLAMANVSFCYEASADEISARA